MQTRLVQIQAATMTFFAWLWQAGEEMSTIRRLFRTREAAETEKARTEPGFTWPDLWSPGREDRVRWIPSQEPDSTSPTAADWIDSVGTPTTGMLEAAPFMARYKLCLWVDAMVVGSDERLMVPVEIVHDTFDSVRHALGYSAQIGGDVTVANLVEFKAMIAAFVRRDGGWPEFDDILPCHPVGHVLIEQRVKVTKAFSLMETDDGPEILEEETLHTERIVCPSCTQALWVAGKGVVAMLPPSRRRSA